MVRNPLRILGLLLTFGCFALFVGCQQSSEPNKAESSVNESKTKKATNDTGDKSNTPAAKKTAKARSGTDVKKEVKEEKTVTKQSKTQSPPPPATIPKVSLTDALHATCRVNVGDVLPEGNLAAADGGNVNLQNQFGEKLTVVFLWEEGRSHYEQLAAGSALKDFQVDIAEPYAKKGVKVIGINVGDNPQSVQQELTKIGIQIPYYFDPSKAYFDKLAKSILPRVYLLDASGKILWFDTEYSQSTRRNLMQAVQVVLGEK
jgi:hypothetical protein